MAVITIREQRETETGFDATLIIEGNSYQIEVSEPFNTKQEQKLEWYFEDWIDYPMLDNIKADTARDSIREYGEELFQQVFQVNPEAHRQYSDLKRNLSQLTIEIASVNPEFQAIHWEALQDPELAHPLAIETTLIRKSIQPKKIKIEVKESPTINLLVVVARPKAESDIPILLLQGMGGMGKTTLLNYLQQWWQVTKFAEDTFYFAYDKRAYNLQQIIFEISKQLYNQFDLERFQAKNISEQCQEISQKLRNKSYVLILDNLESITGQPLAIQNTLEETEKAEIKNFLASLVGGQTKVILGSRITEEWLEDSTFQDNKYQLRGLDPQASSNLAANILQNIESDKSLDEIKTDEYFRRLMNLLAGNPLAIKVILPNLKDKSPQEVLEQLEKAEIDPGGDDKENNILKCIEYSYDNLSELSQKSLLFLFPFKSFINFNTIDFYLKEIEKINNSAKFCFEAIKNQIIKTINWGIIYSISEEKSQLIAIHPLLSYFLKRKLKNTNERAISNLYEGFRKYYQSLSHSYYALMESNVAENRQTGVFLVHCELDNLYQALEMCLKAKESVYHIYICLYLYLNLIHDKVEKLLLTQKTYDNFNSDDLFTKSITWQEDIIPLLGNLANCYQERQEYQKAKKYNISVLNIVSKLTILRDSQKQYYRANAVHNLGVISFNLREYKQAKKYYRQALNIKNKCDDPIFEASTIYQLGIIVQELREYQRARQYYEDALDIFIEFGEQYEQARILYQLGIIAQELREYQRARQYYEDALDIIFVENDKFLSARILHQLGILAQKSREYLQAQQYYQNALDIKVESDSENYRQARTLHQLGMLKQQLKEYTKARQYYKQALNIFIQYNDKYSLGSTYGQLGLLAEDLCEWGQAQNNYLRALEIFLEFDNRQDLMTAIKNVAILHKKTQNNNLLAKAANMLNMTGEEVRKLFEQLIIDNE